MVIIIVNDIGIPVNKLKEYSPVTGDLNSILAFFISSIKKEI